MAGPGGEGRQLALIELAGSTTLDLDGSNRYVLAGSVYLRYDGALVVPGQFGAWTPIGAEQIGSGYKIAWKRGTGDYVVWTVDSSGNYLSQNPLRRTRRVPELRSLEPGFNQDLNGSGGIEVSTPIDALGSTSLANVANVYVLAPSGSSLGTQLKYGGSLAPWPASSAHGRRSALS